MKNALRIALGGAGLAVAALSGASSASAATVVTPDPVTFVDTCGTSHDTYIIPSTTGVNYFVGGAKTAPGVHSVDPKNSTIEVFTVAENGYQLSAPATWLHTFDATTGCAPKATATATPTPSSSATPSATTTGEPSPVSSSSSTSSAAAIPTIAPASPASSDAGTGSGSGSSAVDSTPAATKTSASTLPHTGIDMQTPAELAGACAIGGLALVGGSQVRLRRK